ncbi:MAG: helix-turn-helix transcriptional regulator [Pseudoflavonifractor sp.]
MSVKIGQTEFTEFDDLWAGCDSIAATEKEEIKLRIALIGKLIEAREAKGFSQKQLADMTGLKQPAIARLEGMKTMPQIDTLFKVLQPLGYTLAIVPRES